MMKRKIYAGTITAAMLTVCLLAQGCGNAGRAQTQADAGQKKEAAAIQEAVKKDNKSGANAQAAQGGEAADREKALQTEAALVQPAAGETQPAVTETEAAQQNGQPAVQPETEAVQDTPADSAPVSIPQQEPAQGDNASDQNNLPAVQEQQSDTPVVQEQPQHHQHHVQQHTHSWTPQTTTIHHPAVTHEEPVCEDVWVEDKAAWDEPVYESWHVCNKCNAKFETPQELSNHHYSTLFDEDGNLKNQTEWHGSSHVETIKIDTIHHEAEGHYETRQTGTRTVVDTEAYDEEITSGYHCECGATK